MSGNNRKLFDNLVSRTKIYLVIIFILLVIVSILKPNLIVPSLVIYILILGYTYFANNKRKSEISEQLQDLTLTVDSAAKTSLINAPFPLIIIETDGNVVWKSLKFATEFANVDINTYINDLIIDIKAEIEKDKNKEQRRKSIIKNITIGKKKYKVQCELSKTKRSERKKVAEYMAILYFIDETEKYELEKENKDKSTCVGIIMVDNYEEVMQRVNAEQKTQLMAKVESTIYDWVNQTNGILVKEDRDTYVYIFEQRNLEKIKEDKFAILDTIKDIVRKDKIQLTLSIAISSEGKTDNEVYKSASAAMDVILGRGGDQAVIRENGKYQFFGGKVEEVEKRTKVKARIVAHALEELNMECDKVIIMGHSNPDIDAIGSALGVYRIATSLRKDAYIVADRESPSIKAFTECLPEEYDNVLISEETALNEIDSETLLVVVDTHKKSYVEQEELLDKTNKIVVIDHHRRSADFISQSILTFQEVYASSAAELVTELIQYMLQKPRIPKIVAEGLLGGIFMDTKGFQFKSGVRTFDAAAFLRSLGADTIEVKKMFTDSLDDYLLISDTIRNAEVHENLAIAVCPSGVNNTVIVARAADELLGISGIDVCFVLCNINDSIIISGRSTGEVNVQVILEELGGGGHMNMAGAKLECTIDEAVNLLKEAINKHLEIKE